MCVFIYKAHIPISIPTAYQRSEVVTVRLITPRRLEPPTITNHHHDLELSLINATLSLLLLSRQSHTFLIDGGSQTLFSFFLQLDTFSFKALPKQQQLVDKNDVSTRRRRLRGEQRVCNGERVRTVAIRSSVALCITQVALPPSHLTLPRASTPLLHHSSRRRQGALPPTRLKDSYLQS